MGTMKEQMDCLTRGIATAARERYVSVGESKVQTAGMLARFRRERAEAAQALTSELADDRASRSDDVGASLANARTMCRDFRAAELRTRRQLRRSLADSTRAVVSVVAALRAKAANGRAECARTQHQMAKAQRASLAQDRRDRSRDVAELLSHIHASRRKMAHDLADSLATCMRGLVAEVSGLRKGFMTSVQHSHGRH